LLLYYITDGRQFPGTPAAQRRALLAKIAAAARAGVDFIQLREKDLSARELEALAHESVQILERLRAEDRGLRTRLLINSRTDVALATAADGVHLPAGDLPAAEVRTLAGNRPPATSNFLIAVSCHTLAEVTAAAAQRADLAVFGPVFEKAGGRGVGMEALRQACAGVGEKKMPVLALGGVTLANAAECLRAGAAGVAGIRLFQSGEVGEVVARLRALPQ
jgi:thiamine-phosphate pyrophosphorylase